MANDARVVIVGAGQAGVAAAKALDRAPADVLIIDRNNFQTFQPLLFQVATAALEPAEIAYQVRGIVRKQRNVRFRQGTVWSVDWEEKLVRLSDGDKVPFDYLILGAGAVTNDFGVPGVKEHGFFLKSIPDAVNLRGHVLRQFEAASANPALIDAGALNFVIAGGGPTGVEMAGSLSELIHGVLKKDYPQLDVSRARILLLEAQDSVLPVYGKRSRDYAGRVLEKRGVELVLGDAVARVEPDTVELSSGAKIPTRTLLWAAGVKAHPLAQALEVEQTRGERIVVAGDLSLPYHPYAFAAGDLAGASSSDGKLYPQVAQVAIQQGRHAGRQVKRIIAGKETEQFRYLDKGSMAIIGRNAGIVELSRRYSGMRFRGIPGWLGWLLVHVSFLPGKRSRWSTMLDWTYNFFTGDRPARLITTMENDSADNGARGNWFPEAATTDAAPEPVAR